MSWGLEIMTLNEFLVKAKINTYANAGEGGERNLEDGSKELIYEESEWKYRDRYFGSKQFAGEEVVWRNGKVMWTMNYYGGVMSDKIFAEEVYKFLKKALRQVGAERPFRGPAGLVEGDWAYYDANEGTQDNFEGYEKISYKGEEVYKLVYHGGLVNL